MVSGSKLGGMFTAGLAWLFVTMRNPLAASLNSDVASHQLLLVGSSILLLIVPVVIILMMKKVPGKYLHGYEAAYKVEKEQK